MASALTDLGKNAMLDSAATWPPPYASAHTALPNSSGSNEVTGGSPPYARKALTWAAAATGSKAIAATLPVFDIPAGTTVAYIGFWSAIVGDFYGYWDVTDEAFAGQGTYPLTAGTVSV
jgi:hypothetical protein